jgi:HK97 gp10 family phage protein
MPIEVTGMEEMLQKLAKSGQNVEAVKEKALNAGAEIIRKEMVILAPKDTGFLRENIVITGKRG